MRTFPILNVAIPVYWCMSSSYLDRKPILLPSLTAFYSFIIHEIIGHCWNSSNAKTPAGVSGVSAFLQFSHRPMLSNMVHFTSVLHRFYRQYSAEIQVLAKYRASRISPVTHSTLCTALQAIYKMSTISTNPFQNSSTSASVIKLTTPIPVILTTTFLIPYLHIHFKSCLNWF